MGKRLVEKEGEKGKKKERRGGTERSPARSLLFLFERRDRAPHGAVRQRKERKKEKKRIFSFFLSFRCWRKKNEERTRASELTSSHFPCSEEVYSRRPGKNKKKEERGGRGESFPLTYSFNPPSRGGGGKKEGGKNTKNSPLSFLLKGKAFEIGKGGEKKEKKKKKKGRKGERECKFNDYRT